MAHSNQREAILDAAERVIISSGAAKLTLDAVAREAGVGKGGLLYHFPSKQALLEGLMDCQIRRGHASFDAMLAEPHPGVHPLRQRLQALIKVHERLRHLSAAMVGIAANAPGMMREVADREHRDLEPLLARGPIGMQAVVLQIAVHGLFMQESLGCLRFSPEERERITAAILAMAEELGRRMDAEAASGHPDPAPPAAP